MALLREDRLAAVGVVVLDVVPEVADDLGPSLGRSRDHGRDDGEGHVDPPEPGDQAGVFS